MVSVLQAIIIGLVQGLTELFPISSLGHSVILPVLFNWHINQNASNYLTFLVATHLATAIALLIFFWRDWVKIIQGIFRSLAARQVDSNDAYAKLGWLIVVGSIPAGLLGLFLQSELTKLFSIAKIAAVFLIVNGIILLAAEKYRKPKKVEASGRTPVRAKIIPSALGTTSNLSHDEQSEAVLSDSRIAILLKWKYAIGVGVIQSLALIPGISRSGASMAGGKFFGLNNEDAARFSFLLATPLIGAAALLKIPSLFTPSMSSIRTAAIIGSICAGITAYLSVKFLVKYFQTKTLYPFAGYCIVAASIILLYLLVR